MSNRKLLLPGALLPGLIAAALALPAHAQQDKSADAKDRKAQQSQSADKAADASRQNDAARTDASKHKPKERKKKDKSDPTYEPEEDDDR